MKFDYSPRCGHAAVMKEIGDEGEMPYCENCKTPLFDLFPVCVLCIPVNENNMAALIKQSYGEDRYVGVAGYMKAGETAEAAALREVSEETGLETVKAEFIESMWFERKGMLMLGFLVYVRNGEFRLSGEVKSADWFTLADAENALREASCVRKLAASVRERICKGD